jgi:hypothetical protein
MSAWRGKADLAQAITLRLLMARLRHRSTTICEGERGSTFHSFAFGIELGRASTELGLVRDMGGSHENDSSCPA